MKIGVYKPFKKVFFGDDSQDTAAWSYEVANMAKIFARRGHDVVMLSDTDLKNGQFERISVPDPIFTGKFAHIDGAGKLDRILLFSGVFEKDIHGPGVIDLLRKNTDRLDFVLTDLRLLPPSVYFGMFDNVYTQATSPLEGIGGVYGGIAELRCLDHKFESVTESLRKKKASHRFYFGGTERGRLDDFLEYVWRPGHVITGKSDTLGFDTRVDRKEYLDNLAKAKFSVVIADVDYNKNRFITPRHYENIQHDVISFVDREFDQDVRLVDMTDWRRVDDYTEMHGKMKELDGDFNRYMQLLLRQRQEIRPEFVDGSYVYERMNQDDKKK